MQWRVRRFFCVNGRHGLFFGNGVQGNGVPCPCHTPMEKSLGFIVRLAPKLTSRRRARKSEGT